MSQPPQQPAQAAMTRVQPPLSPTERVVVGLLMRGMTEKQAGAAMGRSHNTVHVHIRNTYRKLGVTSRKMLFQYVQANPDVIEQPAAEAPNDMPRSAAA